MKLFDREELIEMCSAPDVEKAYMRPFLCKGSLNEAKVFLVGINPATPIFPEKIDIDDYLDLLNNYDSFIEYYKSQRALEGKPGLSRTRTGIDAFVNYLSEITQSSIIETNIVTYPTASVKLLEKEPLEIINQGKEIFLALLQRVAPRILVLHGKETLKMALKLFKDAGMISIYIEDTHDFETNVPLFEITYDNGNKGYVAACRHLMYYGYEGKTYSSFKAQIRALAKDIGLWVL